MSHWFRMPLGDVASPSDPEPYRRPSMSHVVMLGDSIFDNAVYVPDRPAVIEQVRRGLPNGWKATLVAVDGHMVEDIPTQLKRIPTDATHLVLSVGGNDALTASGLLREPAATVGD